MKQSILCLDIGTSGIKIGLVDTQLNLHYSAYSQTGMLKSSFSLDALFLLLCQMVSTAAEEAAARGLSMCAMNLSGQMGGLVGVDKHGRSCTDFDSGISIESERYNKKLHEILGEAVHTTTCGSPRNTAKVITCKEEYPDTYKRVEVFLPLHSYILSKIADLPPKEIPIDHTMLAFFGNEDARNLSWSKDLTSALQLDIAKFPDICTPTTQIGTLAHETARITGLPSGLPLYAGLGDQPAGLLGAGFTHSSDLFAVLGSSTLLFAGLGDFMSDPSRRVMHIPAALEPQYYPFTYVNGAGLAIPWFSNICMGSESTKEIKELTKQAKDASPGSSSLMFFPYMAGRQCPYDPDLTGSFIGLNWQHSRGHMFRAVLESIAYAFAADIKHNKQLLAISPNKILCTGGGAKNPLWTQIIADVTHLPVHTQQSFHCTLMGSAITGLIGAGLLEKDHFINQLPSQALYTPEPSRSVQYVPYVKLFEQASFLELGQLCEKLNSIGRMGHASN